MAAIFEEILGPMLLKTPIPHLKMDQEMLPSPNELKGKIILKHKKLPEKSTDVTSQTVEQPECCSKNDDISLITF